MNVTNQTGLTSLHVAALHGHVDLVALLLKHGANIEAKDVNQAGPLHFACQNGHFQVSHQMDSWEAHEYIGLQIMGRDSLWHCSYSC